MESTKTEPTSVSATCAWTGVRMSVVNRFEGSPPAALLLDIRLLVDYSVSFIRMLHPVYVSSVKVWIRSGWWDRAKSFVYIYRGDLTSRKKVLQQRVLLDTSDPHKVERRTDVIVNVQQITVLHVGQSIRPAHVNHLVGVLPGATAEWQ